MWPMRHRPAVLLASLALVLTPALAHAARERAGSIDAFIVLDESGSMKPIFTRVTAYIAEAIIRDYLEPDDYLCIIGFSDIARVRVSQRLSSDIEKQNLVALVRNLNVVPQGYTDMGRALEDTLHQLEALSDPSHEPIVLILTDGLNQPPRDSPYFQPLQPDAGGAVVPTSGFNSSFLTHAQRLSAQGLRIHVVGIGAETDALKLAEALGAGHTILPEFGAAELRTGLARFWDDTINLVRLDVPARPYRRGDTLIAQVHLRSTFDKDREVQLRGARVATLQPLRAAQSIADPAAVSVTLAAARWVVPARGEATFEAHVLIPADLPAGDYRAMLAFDQESAVKFYPQHAEIAFHVPSFWERHGTRVIGGGAALLLALLALVVYRRRPIPVVLFVEGETDHTRPVPFRISATSSIGGGTTDRFRIAGLPQKVAVLERRSVDRFALLSSKPELVPTIPEYALGDPVEIRLGTGPSERKSVRFVRFDGASPK
jgi:Mg-chelatase subunit ChlD